MPLTNTATITLPDDFTDLQLAQLRCVIAEEIAAARVFAPARDAGWEWQPLTRDEAAAFLGTTPERVSQLRADGLPASYALGRQSPRYCRAQLLAWMHGQPIPMPDALADVLRAA